MQPGFFLLFFAGFFWKKFKPFAYISKTRQERRHGSNPDESSENRGVIKIECVLKHHEDDQKNLRGSGEFADPEIGRAHV